MTINPINYHSFRDQTQYTHYDDHADESESDEDVNQSIQPVSIEKEDVNSLPKVPPNSPEIQRSEPIPVPEKKNDHWNICFFGD